MARPRREAGARRRDAGEAAGRIRIAFRLPPETIRRLRVSCAMEDLEPSELVSRLILDRSRRWVVQDRSREPGQAEAG